MYKERGIYIKDKNWETTQASVAVRSQMWLN